MLGTSWLVLFAAAVVAVLILVALALRAVIRRGRTPPVSAAQFQALTEEYRRMSDLAVSASEHVDLRLADLSARVDELRSQVQRILTDVE
jgi:flagellar biosynthesis/type III secretory pathway M-ring protein FliF/YscJ